MVKKIIAAVSTLALFIGAAPALAAPFNANNNPNIVANYPSGSHGIVGEPFLHTGADVVMQAGNSGNFQQWFYGDSTEEGVHGDHSVWLNVGSSTSCPNSSWDLVQNAYPAWGSYLQPGANYCVHTNDFHPSH